MNAYVCVCVWEIVCERVFMCCVLFIRRKRSDGEQKKNRHVIPLARHYWIYVCAVVATAMPEQTWKRLNGKRFLGCRMWSERERMTKTQIVFIRLVRFWPKVYDLAFWIGCFRVTAVLFTCILTHTRAISHKKIEWFSGTIWILMWRRAAYTINKI